MLLYYAALSLHCATTKLTLVAKGHSSAD